MELQLISNTSRYKQCLYSILFLCCISNSSLAQNDETISLDNGVKFYEAEKFQQAREVFEYLVKEDAENSIYYHWLGKSYGRIAENAAWLTAMSMAKKTRKAFEKAVELDETNLDALKDLKQYYLDAPGFLGGSKRKANDLQIKIDSLYE